jgi:hypothetical protein
MFVARGATLGPLEELERTSREDGENKDASKKGRTSIEEATNKHFLILAATPLS